MYFKFIIFALLLLNSASGFAQNDKVKKPKGKKHKFHYLDHTKTVEEIKKIDNKLEKIFYMSLGEFNNDAQAMRTENPVLKTFQRAIAVPIWRERTGEYWYYLGWFMRDKPEKAISQLVYRLSKKNRDTFELACYAIPNEAENNFYPFEWQKEKPFSNLNPKILAAQQTLIYTQAIVARGEDEFEALPTEIIPGVISNGIEYFRLSTVRRPEIYHSYLEFFDKDKKLVFSYPPPDGLEMRRSEKPAFEMVKKQPAKNK